MAEWWHRLSLVEKRWIDPHHGHRPDQGSLLITKVHGRIQRSCQYWLPVVWPELGQTRLGNRRMVPSRRLMRMILVILIPLLRWEALRRQSLSVAHSLRPLVLVGHGNAGKPSMLECLLGADAQLRPQL